MLVAYQPTLVIVDSAGEAMAVDGANPNYDDDVARWVRKFTKWIAVQGPGVLGLDHVVKDAGSRNLQPSGSHRKRDAITGAAYIVEMRPGSEFGIGRQGQARFTVSKDRAGHRVRGQVAGSFTLDATVRPYQVGLEPPEPQHRGRRRVPPDGAYGAGEQHLDPYAGANKKDLRTLGNSDLIDKAMSRSCASATCVSSGSDSPIGTTTSGHTERATRSRKAMRVLNRAHRAHTVPNVPMGTVHDRAHRAHPPITGARGTGTVTWAFTVSGPLPCPGHGDLGFCPLPSLGPSRPCPPCPWLRRTNKERPGLSRPRS